MSTEKTTCATKYVEELHLNLRDIFMYEVTVDLFPIPFYFNGQIDLVEFQIDLQCVKDPRNILRHVQLV
jgi:hypothetical protein